MGRSRASCWCAKLSFPCDEHDPNPNPLQKATDAIIRGRQDENAHWQRETKRDKEAGENRSQDR